MSKTETDKEKEDKPRIEADRLRIRTDEFGIRPTNGGKAYHILKDERDAEDPATVCRRELSERTGNRGGLPKNPTWKEKDREIVRRMSTRLCGGCIRELNKRLPDDKQIDREMRVMSPSSVARAAYHLKRDNEDAEDEPHVEPICKKKTRVKENTDEKRDWDEKPAETVRRMSLPLCTACLQQINIALRDGEEEQEVET